jgi:hypothetical protein
MNSQNTQEVDTLAPEEYIKAMNFIGQNLLSSLVQSVEKLPQALRSPKVISQALAAFLTNVIYKQFPDDNESSQQMLDEISKFVRVQLENIPHSA